ncbi:tRNA1(Val) (adenine(37)-N6)-methyltransferase [Virgibacillus halodenitrificans]|uniref:tRNA1(Val) (adenine(37)-N6)-methyltransferase n=1 Tax=Virgibacillus halodenitrificans TaxID=1482 RepID=UPI00045D0399|nr:tRNA1(Val) (adenine(37)-N6)-methyltransferase [Virgibacillus halodenitrificans]MCG1030265.1 tRNA1(Val) (adenine(37)-N6)-methyltransferase [Virgibacillus halodenitrificans]MEC2157551.1 tRNA1(Val) (adenine(37)-N6)-methyltransferase [Virgibacillus halodenitrificans]MYL58452.1 methyltransferase [Virgibacillus halodenitrificans]CDQ32018.1 N5-glutamine S-adenosyl-L-methionine-dependent methyltransferase [Virgibacillus halodenitrificans]
MVQLYDDERLDYLLADESMKIIQSPSAFSFSLDAVLLAYFASIPRKKGSILDLCTGNGVIPLLLSGKTKAKITGVEIQKRIFHMAERNIDLNELGEQLQVLHGDLKEMQSVLGQSTFDVVTCNPPYFPTPSKTEHNQNEYLTIARHEVYCTLEDVVKACKLHVRPGGKVAMVHRPGRLVDIINLYRQYKLEPKRIQFVYPKRNKEANMLLIEGIRDGKPDLKVLPPLYIYEDDGTYTKEAEDIIYDRI